MRQQRAPVGVAARLRGPEGPQSGAGVRKGPWGEGALGLQMRLENRIAPLILLSVVPGSPKTEATNTPPHVRACGEPRPAVLPPVTPTPTHLKPASTELREARQRTQVPKPRTRYRRLCILAPRQREGVDKCRSEESKARRQLPPRRARLRLQLALRSTPTFTRAPSPEMSSDTSPAATAVTPPPSPGPQPPTPSWLLLQPPPSQQRAISAAASSPSLLQPLTSSRRSEAAAGERHGGCSCQPLAVAAALSAAVAADACVLAMAGAGSSRACSAATVSLLQPDIRSSARWL